MKNLNIKKIDNEKKNERNYGIDLLRIFSMIGVLILHLVLYSVGNEIKPSNKKYKSVWCLESICMCSVNCFALISGVVGYKNYKFSNLIYLWFHIFFYSFVVGIIYSKICYKYFFSIKNINNMFPILINRHWYFNSYFIMYLFVPFLNEGIKNLNKKTFRNIIIFYIFFFSIYDVVCIFKKTIPYHQLNKGFSALWLIILYIIGSYFGKYIINKNNNKNIFYFSKWFLIFLFLTTFNFKLQLMLINKKKDFRLSLFKKYINPIVLFQAISLLMFFSKLKIKSNSLKKLISFFTPLVFGVLLFHSRIIHLKIKIINNFFIYIKEMNANYYFYYIIFFAIFFFFLCSLIDYLRLILFNLFKIRELSICIENVVPHLIDKIMIMSGLENQSYDKIKN